MFEGPRLKIKRADKHIAELSGVLEAFVKSDFCRLKVETNLQTREYILSLDLIRKPPEDIPVIIGDAIHNLRSALDMAYCDALVAVGETPTDFSRFIFEEDRSKLITRLNSGPMKTAPDIIEVIADSIRPYRTRDNPLFGLHQLDVVDKHMLLIPTVRVTSLQHVDARFPNGPNGWIDLHDTTLGVMEGGILAIVGMAGPFELKSCGNPTYSVVFGNTQPLMGEAVVPALQQLSQLVSATLNTLAHALNARSKSN